MYLHELDSRIHGLDWREKKFLQGSAHLYRCGDCLCREYANLTRETAVKERNPKRKLELERMSEICARVPMNPRGIGGKPCSLFG
jgi:hypothetical protein